jgi:large subunit ribosomal protein L21e
MGQSSLGVVLMRVCGVPWGGVSHRLRRSFVMKSRFFRFLCPHSQHAHLNSMPSIGVYLTKYKVGDLVDIKANSAIHKGMPHKFYHGRTGFVYNVSQRAVGLIVNKVVGNRILRKRITVRIEHVKQSQSRAGFLQRVKDNEKIKLDAKAKGVKAVGIKRLPVQPRPGLLVRSKKTEIVNVRPIPYVFVA